MRIVKNYIAAEEKVAKIACSGTSSFEKLK